MAAASSRLPLAFVLTLALPAIFAASWAWLMYGGAIERAASDERADAESALGVAGGALDEGLRAAAARDGCALDVDERGIVVGPFQGPPPSGSSPTPGVAEMAAFARLAASSPTTALPFLEHAAATEQLTPDGWLALARLHGARDPRQGLATLAAATKAAGDAWCGPLPFPLLAALLRSARPDADAEACATELLAQVRRVSASAAGVALEAVRRALPSLAGDARLDAVAVTAAAYLQLADAAAPTHAQPGPLGSVIVPSLDAGDRRLFVVPAASVARVQTDARRRAHAAHPAYELRRVEAGEVTATARSRALPALGETWVAAPRAWPTSRMLTVAARSALGLALATFVLGNLALWQLARRQIALARLRRDFVDIVSHELRTPLAALSLKSEMLAAGDVPPTRVAHYLRGLHSDVRRLDTQVQRILDFARLERGAPLRLQPVPARALLAHGLRAGLPALRLVQQRIVVDVPRTLPAIVGDADVLARALRNLLENAAKYAPPGSTVELRADVRDGMLVVEVGDRGPGVVPGERRAIFLPFRRGATAPSATPGSGLGLALVHAAARAHRGAVDVGSREGGGAVFTLRLPIQRPGLPLPPATEAS